MALTFLRKEHLAPLSPDRGEGSGVRGETPLPHAARTVQKDAGFTVSWKCWRGDWQCSLTPQSPVHSPLEGIFAEDAMHLQAHLRAVTRPFYRPRPTSFLLCLRLRGLSPATAQSLRFLWILRFVTILSTGQRPLLHARRRGRGDCPLCQSK